VATPVILHKGAIEPGINNPIVPITTTNLFVQSEDFLTTWTESNGASVADQASAPNGALIADQLLDNSGTGTGSVSFNYNNVTVAASTQHTMSVYAKADQLDWLYFELDYFTTPSNNTSQWYDLTNGVVGGTPSAGVDDSGIVALPNGWYRCWLSFTTDASDTVGTIRIGVTDADSDVTVDLDGTSSIFLWGAQLEAQPSPRHYIKTSGAAVSKAWRATSTKLWKGAVSPAQVLDSAPSVTGTNVIQAYRGAVEPQYDNLNQGNEIQLWRGAVEPPSSTFVPPVVDDEEANSGGYGAINAYDSYQRKRKRRKKEYDELLDELKALPEVEAEIARIMQAQLRREQEAKEVTELEGMVVRMQAEASDMLAEAYNDRVTRALERAADKATYSRLQAFERELDRAREEEEFLLMAILLLE